MSEELVHQELIDLEENCPCGELLKEVTQAFHVVKSPITHFDNFRTTHEKQPTRSVTTADAKCTRYAISFFVQKEALVKTMRRAFIAHPPLKDQIGNYIAVGEIKPSDGIWNTANPKGHFSLWKYKTHNLSQSFTIIEGESI